MNKTYNVYWLLIEAVQAFMNGENERILVDIVPLKEFSYSPEAMKAHQELHREDSTREFLFFILVGRSQIY